MRAISCALILNSGLCAYANGAILMKYRLWDMSWMEAEEAFERSEVVILPVGTLHGHGPSPISIDSSSVEKIAEEVGRKTGILTLPLQPYGENDKQKFYPGSIAISPTTLESFYIDGFKSIRRNGVKKVIVLNGHGGNRETLIRAGRAAKDFDMIIAILEWCNIVNDLMPELFPEGLHIMELAVAIAIGGKDIADLRGGAGYKGEWKYTVKNIFGDRIRPVMFNNFEYKGARLIIPIQAWDIDLEGPPVLGREVVDDLYDRGMKAIELVVEHVIEFAEDFEKVDISEGLKSRDYF